MNTKSELTFELGQLVTTPNARDNVNPEDMLKSIARHAACDWGDVEEEDFKENEYALGRRLRLFSVYHDRDGTRFWIITV